MREIKFRAWDNVDYMSSPFTLSDMQTKKIEFTSDCPVMQYTGLKDSKGVEIYEGDIVNHDSSIYPCEIIYKRKIAQFMAREIKKNGEFGKVYQISEKKIISINGNIYENQELLKD